MGNGAALSLRSRTPYQLRVQWEPSVWFDHIDFLHQPSTAWEDSIRAALPRSVSLTLEAGAGAVTAPLAPRIGTSSSRR